MISAPDVDRVLSRLISHANTSAADSALGRRIATTIALSLAKVSRDNALSRALAMQVDGRLAAWAKELSGSRASGAARDWARGLGSLLSDRQALDTAIRNKALLPDVPPGSPI